MAHVAVRVAGWHLQALGLQGGTSRGAAWSPWSGVLGREAAPSPCQGPSSRRISRDNPSAWPLEDVQLRAEPCSHRGTPARGAWSDPWGLLVVTPALPLPCSTMMANAATMRILIKGGKVVNDDCTLEADVYIENGIIQQVGRELMIPGGAKVIDATGKLVIPGGIDTSTHFHQTFMNATCVDDFYHGTKVAPQLSPRGVCSPLWGRRLVQAAPSPSHRSVVAWHRLSPCPHPSRPLAVRTLLPRWGRDTLCQLGEGPSALPVHCALSVAAWECQGASAGLSPQCPAVPSARTEQPLCQASAGRACPQGARCPWAGGSAACCTEGDAGNAHGRHMPGLLPVTVTRGTTPAAPGRAEGQRSFGD